MNFVINLINKNGNNLNNLLKIRNDLKNALAKNTLWPLPWLGPFADAPTPLNSRPNLTKEECEKCLKYCEEKINKIKH